MAHHAAQRLLGTRTCMKHFVAFAGRFVQRLIYFSFLPRMVNFCLFNVELTWWQLSGPVGQTGSVTPPGT